MAETGDLCGGASQAGDRVAQLLQDRGAGVLGAGLAGAGVPAGRGLVRLRGRAAGRRPGPAAKHRQSCTGTTLPIIPYSTFIYHTELSIRGHLHK